MYTGYKLLLPVKLKRSQWYNVHSLLHQRQRMNQLHTVYILLRQQPPNMIQLDTVCMKAVPCCQRKSRLDILDKMKKGLQRFRLGKL